MRPDAPDFIPKRLQAPPVHTQKEEAFLQAQNQLLKQYQQDETNFYKFDYQDQVILASAFQNGFNVETRMGIEIQNMCTLRSWQDPIYGQMCLQKMASLMGWVRRTSEHNRNSILTAFIKKHVS